MAGRTLIFVLSAEQDSKEASKPVKEKEQKRYDALCKELGL